MPLRRNHEQETRYYSWTFCAKASHSTEQSKPPPPPVAWTVPCYVTVRLVGNVKMYHRFNGAMMLLAAYLASFIPRCLRALRCPRGCDGSSRW